MPTDDPRAAAIEAVARSLAGLTDGEPWPSNEALGGGLTGTRDDEYRHGMREQAAEAVAAAVPHLTRDLRALHQRDRDPRYCQCDAFWPCPTTQALDALERGGDRG